MTHPRWIGILLLALSTAAGIGCGPQRTLRSVPADLVAQAQVPGMPDVRTFGDPVSEAFVNSLAASIGQYHAYHAAHPDQPMPDTADILVLSGGADDGAYGAGLLCGWSQRGDRPSFRLVTGISTGALIAPLAFLGPEYDPVLQRAFTTITAKDVMSPRGLMALLTNDAIYDTAPLRKLIDSWITDQAIEAIAAEHKKGRRLLVATVNLEAQRPVIWDLGAIAASGHRDSRRLLRQIMLASASIPGAFEPQYIRVEAGGRYYEEVHVDGGMVTQAFLHGAGVNLQTLAERAAMQIKPRPIRLFVIRNGRLYPEHQRMQPLFAPIAGRAISTLIKYQGMNDMYRLYRMAEADGMQFHLASIPSDFRPAPDSLFDRQYMRDLFRRGYEQAETGNPWADKPPHLEAGAAKSAAND